MGFRYTVEDAGVQARLAKLDAAMGDTTPVMDDLGRMLLLRIRRQFELEGSGSEGGKWRSLKPRTISQRAKHGHWPGPILRVQGDLYRSITYKATAKEVVVGTNWPSAAAHQFGYKGLPARPYMLDSQGAFPGVWLKDMTRRLDQHLAQATA